MLHGLQAFWLRVYRLAKNLSLGVYGLMVPNNDSIRGPGKRSRKWLHPFRGPLSNIKLGGFRASFCSKSLGSGLEPCPPLENKTVSYVKPPDPEFDTINPKPKPPEAAV